MLYACKPVVVVGVGWEMVSRAGKGVRLARMRRSAASAWKMCSPL